jgi:hypothetical protein
MPQAMRNWANAGGGAATWSAGPGAIVVDAWGVR